MNEFLNQNYFGNTVQQYIVSAVIFIAGIIIIHIFKKIILSKLKKWSEKTETQLDDILIRGIEKTVVPLLYFGALYFAISSLNIPEKVQRTIDVVTIIVITFFFLRTVTSVIKFILTSYLAKGDHTISKQKQLKGITTLASVLVWGLGLIFVLDNLGFKISAVIAGLGIGGIAVALAAQTILGDLFSYFVIFFDRPFETGDFIIIDNKLGVVEQIGIKTTRIRSLSGEQLVFSNTDLTNSRVHNYKKMERRRVVFSIGIVYQTTYEKLKIIPDLVKQIITEQQDADFDRGHFSSYGDFSLNFEFVYYVTGADYNKYMDIQQAINLKIFEEFSKRKIEFAYPTQTLFLTNENGNGSVKRSYAEN
ncbi:MAG: mechanosensitive ion channel family protein [Ignavibacteriales bacterium]|nr:MAG: mechanosensitive ion channel family protein [Ignavibacteriales bacterium]